MVSPGQPPSLPPIRGAREANSAIRSPVVTECSMWDVIFILPTGGGDRGHAAEPVYVSQVTVRIAAGRLWSFRAREWGRAVLDGQVSVDAFDSGFASEAGALDAAEGCRSVGDDAHVDADHAGLELGGDRLASLEGGGEDVGREAVVGYVCCLECVLAGVEPGAGAGPGEDLPRPGDGVPGGRHENRRLQGRVREHPAAPAPEHS